MLSSEVARGPSALSVAIAPQLMCAAVPTRSDFIIAFQLGLMVKRTLSAFWTVA